MIEPASKALAISLPDTTTGLKKAYAELRDKYNDSARTISVSWEGMASDPALAESLMNWIALQGEDEVLQSFYFLLALLRHASKGFPVSPRCSHDAGAFQFKTLKVQEIRRLHQNFYSNRTKIDQDRFLIKYIPIKHYGNDWRENNNINLDFYKYVLDENSIDGGANGIDELCEPQDIALEPRI
nr:unnamed protein product [Callosobruchus analis]